MPQQDSNDLTRTTTATAGDQAPNALSRRTTKTWGVIKIRTDHDVEDQDWWVASIAIPLLAATLAPLANVLSISALVSWWRTNLYNGPNNPPLAPLNGSDIQDPHWVYGLNLASLITGYAGNVFLLMNFTNRIRYIIALPMTIILWYISTALLIAIQISMNTYQPPKPPYQIYTQAFWYGVIAAVLYLLCSMMLMVNMVGYFLGHYPQQFNLTDAQRTLILQTFLFFIWLAGGAGVYATLEQDQGWNFSDALYFCDVTILTIGFGDLVPTTNVGRGLLVPYSIGGIIMLGLMVSSISDFAMEIGQTNIVQKRANRKRLHTLEKSRSLEEKLGRSQRPLTSDQIRSSLSKDRGATSDADKATADGPQVNVQKINKHPVVRSLKHTGTIAIDAMQGKKKRRNSRRLSSALLHEEKDRFDAMRKIQHDNTKFKKWTALCLSTTVLFVLWLIGAVAFWQIEGNAQDMGYFKAFYFCFVSLVTIGYGDFSPITNAGRPFFVIWSLLAVPSITILISNMADTVVAAFKKGTEHIASFTLLPEQGIWRRMLERHPWLLLKIERYQQHKTEEKRVAAGFETGPPTSAGDSEEKEDYEVFKPKTIDELALQHREPPSEHEMAHSLSLAIRRTAQDFRKTPHKRYGYEEWVEFTTLIRFSKPPKEEGEEDSDDEDLIEWDWIGEDSPMMTDKTEPEWLLDRLCESMGRYVKRQRREQRDKHAKAKGHHGWVSSNSDDADEIEKEQLKRFNTSGSSPASSS